MRSLPTSALNRAVHAIRVPTAIETIEGSILLTFQGGEQATVPADHPDRELILDEAQRSLQRQKPVGLILDSAGRVVDLSHTHDTCVRSVQDYSEDPNRVEVCCWGFSSICYLARDHPEFERIRKTLTEAIASDSPVILSNETWPIRGETETWLKILDARPVGVPAEEPGVNGAAAREGVPTTADQGG